MTTTTDDSRLLEESSLQVLKIGTLERLANRLDQTKYLMARSGNKDLLRDWRGLMEVAGLDYDETQKIRSSSPEYTKNILLIWCRKSGATVQSLLEGLSVMDRFDVVDDLSPLMIADCQYARDLGISLASSLEIPHSEHALTLHDLDALAHGHRLPTYDAIVLFGDSEIDREFGYHVVERLEAGGRKIFVHERDLVVGTMAQDASMDIIRERCRKVIAILTPTFESSKENLFLTKYAQSVSITEGRSIIIPVIYSKEKLEYQLIRNLPYSKLPYDPSRKYNNFWTKLFAAVGLTDVGHELTKCTFPGPEEREEKEQARGIAMAMSPSTPRPSGIVSASSEDGYLRPQILGTVLSGSNPSISNSVPSIVGAVTLPDDFGETDDSQVNLILPDPPSQEPGEERQKSGSSMFGKLKRKLKISN